MIYGNTADAEIDAGVKGGRLYPKKKKKLNMPPGMRIMNFRKIDNWLYVFNWSSAVQDVRDVGGHLTTWADEMNGLLTLLPAAPTSTKTVTDVLHYTYGGISLDVELDRALDLDLVTIEGTLVLTKVLLYRDPSSAHKARNWYYNATITLSCDKTLNLQSLTGIDVIYRGNSEPIGHQTG